MHEAVYVRHLPLPLPTFPRPPQHGRTSLIRRRAPLEADGGSTNTAMKITGDGASRAYACLARLMHHPRRRHRRRDPVARARKESSICHVTQRFTSCSTQHGTVQHAAARCALHAAVFPRVGGTPVQPKRTRLVVADGVEDVLREAGREEEGHRPPHPDEAVAVARAVR